MAAEPSTTQAARVAADPEHLVAQVQELTADLEAIGDPAARETAEQLTSAVVQMYGAGLERIVDTLERAGPAGKEIGDELARDDLVASLLLIHDLYPVPLEDRVHQALERVRPYMESHGGDVELLGIEDGVARLRLQGSCRSCAASSATLELAVRQALEEAAPDLEGMDVEGVPDPGDPGLTLPMSNGGPPAGNGGGSEFALPVIGAGGPSGPPSWFEVDGAAAALPADSVIAVAAGGSALVIANVEGTLLAYRNACAGCGGPLEQGSLSAGALTCPHCRRRFALPRAGRSLEDDGLQLQPVPLLREDGRVKVALAP